MLCIDELHLILEVVLHSVLVEYCLSITPTIKVCNFSIVRGFNTSRVFFKHFLIVLNISHLGAGVGYLVLLPKHVEEFITKEMLCFSTTKLVKHSVKKSQI